MATETMSMVITKTPGSGYRVSNYLCGAYQDRQNFWTTSEGRAMRVKIGKYNLTIKVEMCLGVVERAIAGDYRCTRPYYDHDHGSRMIGIVTELGYSPDQSTLPEDVKSVLTRAGMTHCGYAGIVNESVNPLEFEEKAGALLTRIFTEAELHNEGV